MVLIWTIALALALVLTVGLCTFFYWVASSLPKRLRQRWHTQREQLQSEFLAAACASGKPRGLLWKSIEWSAIEPVLARERRTGEFVALVPITIQFQAVVGGDMEGLPEVANLRTASAVFQFRQGRWHTSGRALFNLNPEDALVHLKDELSVL